MEGQLSNVPWDDFANEWEHGKSFWLDIGEKTWEVCSTCPPTVHGTLWTLVQRA